MTIGLVLLALVSILIFFGVTETFFRKIGIKNWLAFVLVVLLVAGAIIPKISIGGFLNINIGGFIVPLVIMTMFLALIRTGLELLRAFISLLAVASVAVSVRILIEPNNAGLIFASSLIVGFVGAVVAFLTARSRIAVLASLLGGIILGDIIINILYRFILDGYTISLGAYGVFDSIIIGLIVSVILVEAVGVIKRINSQRRISRTALSLETAKDEKVEQKNQQSPEGSSKEAEEKIINATTNNHDNFFDEFI